MHIPWPGTKCILCSKETPLSDEHLIPQALGGNLVCSFLCRKCNSTVGANCESEAKADPSIRIAVGHLKSEISSDLSRRLSEGQKVLADGPGGTERGQIRRGQLQIRSRMAEDGSLIQPTKQARKSINTILLKSGVGETPIANAMREFEDAPENQKVTLVPGLEIVKWSVESLRPDLGDSSLMSPLVPLKIGYEFIACHLGTAVYENAPQLDDIRFSIREMVEESTCFEVERLNALEYKPFHGICFEGNSPHARVLVRLFGWLAFRVHFRHLAIGGPRFAYTQYLDTKRETLRALD